MKVLFIVTSQDVTANASDTTGVWLEEIAAAYYVFNDAGTDITMASTNGGAISLDPRSLSIIAATRTSKRFLGDVMAMEFLAQSMKVQDVRAIDFDMVFLTGAHSGAYDLADNKAIKHLLETFNMGAKPIASVCYGVAGLISLQNESGELLVKGRKLTCYSNSEEKSSVRAGTTPFLLETKLTALGALYRKGDDFVGHIVIDGNIITGQNPASSGAVAKALLEQGEHNKTLYSYSDSAILN